MYKKPIIVALAAVGCLTVGCIGAEEGPEQLGVSRAGIGGLPAGNHYYPKDVQQSIPFIKAAAGMVLAQAAPHDHSLQAGVTHLLVPGTSTPFLSTGYGANAFDLAVGCALGAGDSVSWGAGAYTANGLGIMATTDGWRTKALTGSEQNDLFTCMMTRLNPDGLYVNLLLGGPHVTETDKDESEYSLPEAIWQAVVDNPQQPTTLSLIVWPSPDLITACGNISWATRQITKRTCPIDDSSCGLQVIDAGAYPPPDCTGSELNRTCYGRAAIETKLKPADAALLYPDCAF